MAGGGNFNPGALDHRVELRDRQVTRTAGGGETVIDPLVIESFDCEIRPLSGRELMQAQQAQAATTHRVRCWHSEYVTYARYLHHVHDGRDFHIHAIRDFHDAHDWMELDVSEAH